MSAQNYTVEPTWDSKTVRETWDWKCGHCEQTGNEDNAEAAEDAAKDHLREAHKIITA